MSKSSTFIRGKTRVTGEDKMYIIIFIPTGVAHLKEALDRAIESVPGCVALLDGVIYSKFFYFPYVFGESSYIIEGIPLIDPSLANHDDIPLYRKIELDQKGQIKKTEYLSEKEYMALKEKIVKDYGEIRFNNSEQLY
ncbi:MAG: hypothetical protein N2662_00995 [Bacteroidales bacterium]|nr:hypothetical protein [Bacteroidales bacterium]